MSKVILHFPHKVRSTVLAFGFSCTQHDNIIFFSYINFVTKANNISTHSSYNPFKLFFCPHSGNTILVIVWIMFMIYLNAIFDESKASLDSIMTSAKKVCFYRRPIGPSVHWLSQKSGMDFYAVSVGFLGGIRISVWNVTLHCIYYYCLFFYSFKQIRILTPTHCRPRWLLVEVCRAELQWCCIWTHWWGGWMELTMSLLANTDLPGLRKHMTFH